LREFQPSQANNRPSSGMCDRRNSVTPAFSASILSRFCRCIDSVTMTERIQRKTACVVPVPPLDVAWVWYLHKLDPKSYQTDCCQWYGHILDAPLGVSPFRYTSAVSSRVDHEFYPCASMYDEFIERISAIASKQSSFLWNVRSPEFGDTCFLRESVSRYETMLKLAKNDPKECTAVSYAVENVWRAHLSFPRQYLEDCLRLAGRCVDHNGPIIRDETFLSSSPLIHDALLTGVSIASTPTTEQAALGATSRDSPRSGPPDWFWTDRRSASGGPDPPLPVMPAPTVRSDSAIAVLGRGFGATSEQVRRRIRYNHHPWSGHIWGSVGTGHRCYATAAHHRASSAEMRSRRRKQGDRDTVVCMNQSNVAGLASRKGSLPMHLPHLPYPLHHRTS